MNDLVIFALLFIAIAIGWWLGRRSAQSRPSNAPRQSAGEYYRGLNYVLDGRADGAVDAFIDSLDVNADTLETHIALGNLLRKRGEVDRAIRIHQNLLARPSLPVAQVHHAHLELARDYISAGLHDRAERLLLDLVEESPEQRRSALLHLLDIYQSERDWVQSVEVARKLLPRRGLLGGGEAMPLELQQVPVALAHFYCEIASEKMREDQWAAARSLLQEALKQDRRCVRASLLLGEVDLEQGHPKRAIRALQRVRVQDPDYISEMIPIVQRCYRMLGDERGLRTFYRECLASHPSVPLLLAIAEDLKDSEGEREAADFLVREMQRRPTMRGVSSLLTLELQQAEGPLREKLTILQAVVEDLVVQRPAYRCRHCGFSGHQLHWHCPGCKHWGEMRAIGGAEPID